MSALGRNISANLMSNVWSTALILLLTPVYVHSLGVESYGLIGFYQSWVAIVAILDTGISATAGREIAWLMARVDDRANIPTFMRSLELVYWAIVVAVGVVLLIAASAFGADWLRTENLSSAVVRSALMLMAVSLVAQTPSGLYVAGLMGLQRQVEASGLLAVFGTIRGVGSLIVLWKVAPDIRAFFVWQILASALQTTVMRFLLWKRIRVPGQPIGFSREMLHSVKAFAGGMVIITALSVVLTQIDKVILSRLVSLEALGYYMLAWAVASGLYRVATPIIQALGPRFTELVAAGQERQLAATAHLASQLMSVIILPPAALIVFLAKPILTAWTGKAEIAAGSAPILSVLIVGTAAAISSFPAVSILYSRKRLRPVIIVNVVSLVVMLPGLILLIINFGVTGAAISWGLYGTTLYLSYQALGMRGLPGTTVGGSIVRDFMLPAVVSVSIAAMARYWVSDAMGRWALVACLGAVTAVGWLASLLVCSDLRATAIARMKWTTQPSL